MFVLLLLYGRRSGWKSYTLGLSIQFITIQWFIDFFKKKKKKKKEIFVPYFNPDHTSMGETDKCMFLIVSTNEMENRG